MDKQVAVPYSIICFQCRSTQLSELKGLVNVVGSVYCTCGNVLAAITSPDQCKWSSQPTIQVRCWCPGPNCIFTTLCVCLRILLISVRNWIRILYILHTCNSILRVHVLYILHICYSKKHDYHYLPFVLCVFVSVGVKGGRLDARLCRLVWVGVVHRLYTLNKNADKRTKRSL